MKTLRNILGLLAALALLIVIPAVAGAAKHDRPERIHARLIGYEEVPSVSTIAQGSFDATLDDVEAAIDYTLTYSGLQGTVQQAHIHFAQKGVNGSIVIWLCQTATTPAPAAVVAITPFCPASPGGTVTGHITTANVIAAATASQQIAAGELAEVIAAIRAGVAYANVHSTPLTPGGEIRGQLRVGDDDDDHDQGGGNDKHDHD
jgi:CHRD domain-containing protein